MATFGDRGSMVELSLGTQIELSISCRNLPDMDILSKSDPFCVLYLKDPVTNKWLEKSRTETIQNNLNPDFVTKFLVEYSFGDAVELRFELYDEDEKSTDLSNHDFLGLTEVMLDKIVSSKGGLELNLKGTKKNRGKIIVTGQELASCKDSLYMEWSAMKLDKMDTFGKSDPFLAIHRQLSNGKYTVVHRTEVIKKNLNPKWRPFNITLSKLCDGDLHRQLKVECWDWNRNGTHSYIGAFETTVNMLQAGPGSRNTYNCINEKKLKKQGQQKYKNSGQVKLDGFKLIRKPTFVDYLLGGTELHCTFAVDFGQANGELHQLDPSQPNLYQQAIRAVGTVMESYDRHNSFPAIGFGANDGSKHQHFFYMNGHAKNPNCESLDGILQAYKRSVDSVTPSGSTYMAPAIEYITRLVEGSPPGEQYHVLVMFTNGTVHDMAQTCSAIVNAASLPLSIILVGIGNNNFKNMEILDGDEERLVAGNTRAERDIVQFVPFRDYVRQGEKADISERRLARAVLEEVPDQLTSYMESNNIQPNPPMHTRF